jgi:hypothetical protein
MAYNLDFGDSDEEMAVDGAEGSKSGEGAPAKPPSPPPAPPAGTPPPPPLLLPEHVTMGDENEGAGGQEAPPLEELVENADMTGIAVLGDSIATVSLVLSEKANSRAPSATTTRARQTSSSPLQTSVACANGARSLDTLNGTAMWRLCVRPSRRR